jgi:AcrR family transcriptional regulator
MTAGRRRSFDEAQALETAMRVFWRRGYQGTSLSDLTAALGINKPSLYAAFGNKEQLFARALAHYGHHHGLPLVTHLLEPADAPLRERVRAYLTAAARLLTDPALPGGCLVAQSSCEAGGGGLPDAALRSLAGVRGETRRVLAEVFAREQAAGRLAAGHDPEALARYLMTLMMGMAAMARGGTDLAALAPVIDLAVEAF